MFVSDALGVNQLDHLTIGGADAVELAGTYGTPLYVMDEGLIRKNARAFRESIDRYYEGRGHVAFASKAFCCKEICRIMQEEGLWLDVVSGGELYTALSAGFPAEHILFHGNNKSVEELAEALDKNVGRIVVDHFFEMELLNQLALAAGKTADIEIRIKPGVEAHTHEFIQTGQIDSKFGFALETGEALEGIRKAISLPNLNLRGLHCHIGSQIFEITSFTIAARVMLGLAAQAKSELGWEMEELNLGGGFGIKYLSEHTPTAYEDYMKAVSRTIRDTCRQLNLSMPCIIIEPGRSIVGSAGITLYKIGAIKEIPGIRTYLSVDGGMADNPRYALYQSEYEMLLAARATAPKTEVYTVAGRCCESGDLLGKEIPLPKAQVGEVLAVLATGAYNYSMASNYNRLPKPAVVMVKDEQARVVVRRETYEDVAAHDV
ncbi:MAG: diaminopimelate decarboxylase [Oscillospiraceae bacterium]|jgi:diaminopimelate decarboxylase